MAYGLEVEKTLNEKVKLGLRVESVGLLILIRSLFFWASVGDHAFVTTAYEFATDSFRVSVHGVGIGRFSLRFSLELRCGKP